MIIQFNFGKLIDIQFLFWHTFCHFTTFKKRRRFSSRLLIPMFIGTPCIYLNHSWIQDAESLVFNSKITCLALSSSANFIVLGKSGPHTLLTLWSWVRQMNLPESELNPLAWLRAVMAFPWYAKELPDSGQSRFDLIWFDLIWFDLIWFDLIWFDLIWFGLVWFGLVWFGLIWGLVVFGVWGLVWFDFI